MAYIYVKMNDSSPVGDGEHTLPVLENNRRSLIKGNVDLAIRLISENFKTKMSKSNIESISVDQNPDPDDDDDFVEDYESPRIEIYNSNENK